MLRTLLLVAALTWGSALAGTQYVQVSFSGEQGATVVLDGKTLGVLPATVQVPAGVHTFEVISRTGLTTHVTREITPGGEGPLAVHLAEGEPAAAAVTGVVNFFGVAGTTVYLDGEELGAIPLSKELAEGSYTFELELPGGERFTVSREVAFKGKGVPANLVVNP